MRVVRLLAMISVVLSGRAFAQSTPFFGSPTPVPGTIQAEDFDNGGQGIAYGDASPGNAGGAYRSTDVDIEAAAGGGYDVGWITAGEWMNYTIAVPTAGAYTIQLRIASPGGASMHVGFNEPSNVWQSLRLPANGGWQAWTTVSFTATLGAGTQLMTVYADTAGYNLDAVVIAQDGGATSGTLSPYHGAPAPVPGTIQAEDFDNGGEGVAYHDSTSGNAGGAFRFTDVDIEPTAGGGYDVGWTTSGEWLNYTVNVASAGSYRVELRIASPGGGTLHVGFNGASNVWQTVSVPATGGWQTWTTVSFTATLGADPQQMTLVFDTGGYNVDSISISTASGGTGSGSGTMMSVVTWNIEINDASETHARQAMDLLLASGPRPQVIAIQEAYASWFNVYLDELQQQTGQTWYGAFGTHCAPGNWNGSACTAGWYQGVGIFSSHPITASNAVLFPYADCWTSARVGLRAQLDVNGLPVHVFTTHLQTGGCTNDAQARYNSMRDLKGWASQYAGPQLVAGDFNADPDQIDTSQGMSPTFIDSWAAVGQGARFTCCAPATTMKLDYWFGDALGRAAPQTSVVNTGTGSLSDHAPLEATFLVK